MDETAEAEQGQRSAFCKRASARAAKTGHRNQENFCRAAARRNGFPLIRNKAPLPILGGGALFAGGMVRFYMDGLHHQNQYRFLTAIYTTTMATRTTPAAASAYIFMWTKVRVSLVSR